MSLFKSIQRCKSSCQKNGKGCENTILQRILNAYIRLVRRHTFMPIDFSLLSSKTTSINGINEKIDKRSSGYKRRVEHLQSAPDQIPAMIERALSNGIEASHVLMDTWFTQQPLSE